MLHNEILSVSRVKENFMHGLTGRGWKPDYGIAIEALRNRKGGETDRLFLQVGRQPFTLLAVLGNILIQTIQQVLLITEQLDKAKNHYGKFKDIYEGNKRLLGDVKGKITDLKKKARGLKDWEEKIKNVEEVLYIIDEIITRGKSVSGVVVGEAKNLSSSMELQKKLFLESEELRMYVTATDDPEMLKNAGVKELTAHMAITQTQILKALNTLGDGSRESLAFQTREETEKIAKRASMENLNSTLMSFIGGGGAKSRGSQQKKRPY